MNISAITVRLSLGILNAENGAKIFVNTRERLRDKINVYSFSHIFFDHRPKAFKDCKNISEVTHHCCDHPEFLLSKSDVEVSVSFVNF